MAPTGRLTTSWASPLITLAAAEPLGPKATGWLVAWGGTLLAAKARGGFTQR
jgi:hypothetical protein